MDNLKYMHGGNIVRASKVYGLDPGSIIDFSANINPLGPPKGALEAIVAGLSTIARYPDPDCVELRQALARYLALEPHNLILGNGASELIQLIVWTLRPKRAGILVPAFSEYGHALESVGSEVVEIPFLSGKGFTPSIDEITGRLSGLDMLFICNPNNPTGAVLSKEDLMGVARVARKSGTFLVVDEAFIDLIENMHNVTMRNEAVCSDNILVLGSLTKFFALPGLRIGYGVGAPTLIRRLWNAKDPWSVNALSQLASLASLADTEFADRTRSWVRAERAFLFAGLSGLNGLRPYPPSANYILVDLRETGRTAAWLCDSLGRKGILARDCSNFPALDEYHVRFAVRTREQNEVLLATLEDVL